jgi:hypothetical protein
MEKPMILKASRTNSSTGTWAHDPDKVTAENNTGRSSDLVLEQKNIQ